jgi:hypothetical protein
VELTGDVLSSWTVSMLPDMASVAENDTGLPAADVPDTGNTMPAEALCTKDTKTKPSTATALA